MNQQAKDLASRIQRAFAGVAVPSPDSLAGVEAGLDGPILVEHFAGKTHQQLPNRLTRFLGEDLLHMSRAGVHYFLPDFLCYLLTDSGQAEEGVLNQMLRLLIRANNARLVDRFPALTEPQRTVVIEWLRYVTSHIDQYFANPEDEELLAQLVRSWR